MFIVENKLDRSWAWNVILTVIVALACAVLLHLLVPALGRLIVSYHGVLLYAVISSLIVPIRVIEHRFKRMQSNSKLARAWPTIALLHTIVVVIMAANYVLYYKF